MAITVDEVRDGLRHVRIESYGDYMIVWLVGDGRVATQVSAMRLPLTHVGDQDDTLRAAFADMTRDDALWDFGLHLPPGNVRDESAAKECQWIDGGACEFHPSMAIGLAYPDRIAAWLERHDGDRDDAIFALLREDFEDYKKDIR